MTRLNCENVRDAYPDLLNDKLDMLEAEEVRAHIASCEACSTEAAIVASLHSRRVRVPNALYARVAEQLSARAQPAKRPTRVPLLLAASVAIALVGGSVLLQSPPDTPRGGAAARGFGFVGVETAMLSGKASLNDWTEEELEMLLKEMES